MNEPIRIAQIVGKWVGGGVEAVIMNYYRNMDKSKIQFDFICDSDSTNIPYEEIESLGGKVILVPPYQKVFKYQKELVKIFKDNKYNVVHSHINTLSVFPLRAAKKAGVKFRIAHSHSTTNKKEWKKNILKQVLRPFSKFYATHYMCCSEFAGRWLFGNKTFDKGNVYVLNNAIELDKFKYSEIIRQEKRRELGINDETLVIGHVGRFVQQKNHAFLIDVFNEVHKVNSNSVLILVGQGPLEEEIKEKVKKLGLSNNVKFLGQRIDVNELYQTFDVFLLPSLYEGLGMVLIEAQSAGCYCIASSEVPKEVSVNNFVKFIDLNSDLVVWRDLVLNINKSERKTKNGELRDFDIKVQAKTLEEKYLYFYRKRISFFSQRWTSGGIERVILTVIPKYRENYTFEVITSQKESDVYDKVLTEKNVNLFVLNKKNNKNPLIRNIITFNRFKKYLINEKPDVVYINVYNSMSNIYGYIAKHANIKKIILHAHNNGFDKDKYKIKTLLNNLSKLIFRCEEFEYIACSKEAALFCFSKNNINKCDIVYNGIVVKNFSYNKNIRDLYRKKLNLENMFVVGNVGRMTEQKNQLRLLEIFFELKKEKNNSKLLIVGDGPLEYKIKNKIKELDMENDVIIFNRRDDVECLMQAMDCFVFSSIFEGFGVVAIEAQASGLPTFISKDLSASIFATDLSFGFSLSNSNVEIVKLILSSCDSITFRNTPNMELYDESYMIDTIQSKF